jgi:hypothetical protein
MGELLEELKNNHGEEIPLTARVTTEGGDISFVWDDKKEEAIA